MDGGDGLGVGGIPFVTLGDFIVALCNGFGLVPTRRMGEVQVTFFHFLRRVSIFADRLLIAHLGFHSRQNEPASLLPLLAIPLVIVNGSPRFGSWSNEYFLDGKDRP